MEFYGIYLPVFVITVLTSFVSARAVNISNTWMLPEEGFPVFYRYFRDRISWYEADAVCQFHHANLVTADSTSQYDAIRAYLKELDITENIWIGLSKTTERRSFQWTNFHTLNGDGHWQQPIPKTAENICVGMDPAADFLWKPMTCGGPDVASFICELPVPSWAMGPKGCLLTELPSLTVLYIPEQLALELTSDCGLDGTKRIACKGDADREEILKQLTCAISPDEFDDKSTKPPVSPNTASNTVSDISPEDTLSSKSTKAWTWTSNTIDIDYDMPTRHRRETEDTLSPSSTKSTTELLTQKLTQNSKTTLQPNSNYNTEATSSSPEEVTLDLIDSHKVGDVKTTQISDLTTENVEEQGSGDLFSGISTTDESKSVNSEVEDTGEYPSAIAQGQLFSIIENGTMFDIIEVNETTSDDMRLTKDIVMTTSQTDSATLKTSSDNVYTTVIYHKEPPSDSNFVTNKSIKKNDNKQFKKHMIKDIDAKKSNGLKVALSNKELSKEVEMLPGTVDSLLKLNRTFRKELPPIEGSNILHDANNEDDTENVSDKHQHVEIKWHQGNNNVTQMKLFITTKRLESNQAVSADQRVEFSNITKNDSGPQVNGNQISFVNKSKEDNSTQSTVLIPEEVTKRHFLPKSLIGETVNVIGSSASASPAPNNLAEPEPEVQPRPNRQRQLTRPQRRSFYPYFFSRVLG